MNLTKFQKKLVKYILKFKPNQTEYSLKILFENILKTYFKNIGIEISKNEVLIFIKKSEVSTKKILFERKRMYEFLMLIYFLLKEEYLNCIKTEEINRFQYCLNIPEKQKIKLPLNQNTIDKIYENIQAYFYISPLLEEFKRNFYTDLERINLKYTLIALYSSIIISLLGILMQYYTAKFIDTTVILKNVKYNNFNSKLELKLFIDK